MSSLAGNTSSWIHETETAIVTANSAVSQRISDLGAALSSPTGNTAAWIQQTEQAIVTANSATAQRVTDFGASLSSLAGNTASWIQTTEQAIVTANSATASRVTDLGSTVGTLAGNTSAWIHTTETSLATANLALSNRIDAISASSGSGGTITSASITDFAEAVATATSSYATSISSVVSNVGNLKTNVSTLSSSVDGMSGKYGVTVDANGHIAGFQILSGATGPSEFIITADSFKLYTDGGNKNPFSIIDSNIAMTGSVTINGSLLVTGSVTTATLHADAASAISSVYIALLATYSDETHTISLTHVASGGDLIIFFSAMCSNAGTVPAIVSGTLTRNGTTIGTTTSGTMVGYYLGDGYSIPGGDSLISLTMVDPAQTGSNLYTMDLSLAGGCRNASLIIFERKR